MRTSRLLYSLGVIIIYIALTEAQVNTIWPAPRSASYGKTTLTISSQTFNFKCTGKICSDVIQQAFKRFVKKCLRNIPSEFGKLQFINIYI